MSIFGDYGSPEFGLDDVKVGTHDGDGTYTGLVDVPSVQLLNMDLQTISAILEGDDRRTDMHAIAIGGTVRFRFGSIPFDALEILTGKRHRNQALRLAVRPA